MTKLFQKSEELWIAPDNVSHKLVICAHTLGSARSMDAEVAKMFTALAGIAIFRGMPGIEPIMPATEPITPITPVAIPCGSLFCIAVPSAVVWPMKLNLFNALPNIDRATGFAMFLALFVKAIAFWRTDAALMLEAMFPMGFDP